MSKEFGLIGFPLSHSFSREYFLHKFSKENIKNTDYQLFSIKNIEELPLLLIKHPLLEGLNITHPTKTQSFLYLMLLTKKHFL
jgi:shikimate dehydrogenase